MTAHLHSRLIAALALLPLAAGAAQAQTFQTRATGLISQKANYGFDSVQLKTWGIDTNQLWVDIDMNSNLGEPYSTWTSAYWLPNDGVRRAASMLGTDNFGDPAAGRKITLQNLTLNNTDMDTNDVLLKFQPTTGSASLTLQDSSITGQYVPSLTPAVPFTLHATGVSEIKGWYGQLSATTELSMNTGAELTINKSGDVHSTSPNDLLYFSQEKNVGLVNGGVLNILDSNVLFGKKPADLANESTITVSNGGALNVKNYLYDAARLETDSMTITGAGSKLALADNTSVVLRDNLTLNGAAVTTGDSGQVKSETLVVSGASTITVSQATNISKADGVTTGVVAINRGANLTIAGDGVVAVDDLVQFQPGPGAKGEIHVTGGAYLRVAGENGYLDVDSNAILSTERTSPTVVATVEISENAVMSLSGTGQFTNNGALDVHDGGTLLVTGHQTIQGGKDGNVEISQDGKFAFGGTGHESLTTGNTVDFGSFSALAMTIDAAAATSDKITVGGKLFISDLADLDLSIVNDKLLTVGTKFVLIDYSADQILGFVNHFNGYADGTVFDFGLNAFEILYRDAAYDFSDPTVITLTALGSAPEPATYVLFSLGFLGLAGVGMRRGRIAAFG